MSKKEIKLITIGKVVKGEELRATTVCKACGCQACNEQANKEKGRFVQIIDPQIKYFLHEKCLKEIGKGRKTFEILPHSESNYENVAKRCVPHILTSKVGYLNAVYFASFGWSVESVLNQYKKLVVSPTANNAKATGKLVKSALSCGTTTCNDENIDSFEQFKELTDLLH